MSLHRRCIIWDRKGSISTRWSPNSWWCDTCDFGLLAFLFLLVHGPLSGISSPVVLKVPVFTSLLLVARVTHCRPLRQLDIHIVGLTERSPVGPSLFGLHGARDHLRLLRLRSSSEAPTALIAGMLHLGSRCETSLVEMKSLGGLNTLGCTQSKVEDVNHDCDHHWYRDDGCGRLESIDAALHCCTPLYFFQPGIM